MFDYCVSHFLKYEITDNFSNNLLFSYPNQNVGLKNYIIVHYVE